jgi:hypothetical protein
MENFRVVCVNDKARPKEFPVGLWIEQNEIYTVVDAKYLARQHMTIGYKLAEIELPEDSVYQYFLSNRFRPYTDEDEMLEAALEELLEETEVVVL